MLAQHLEKLRPDSVWARRASGCRGTLLRYLSRYTQDSDISLGGQAALIETIDLGYKYLHRAAREIPAPPEDLAAG